MCHRASDAAADGGDDENGGFALGTIFTVSRESLPSLLRHHQRLNVVPFIHRHRPNNSLLPHNLARLRIGVTGACSSTIARTDDRGVRKHRKPQC